MKKVIIDGIILTVTNSQAVKLKELCEKVDYCYEGQYIKNFDNLVGYCKFLLDKTAKQEELFCECRTIV